MKLERSAARLVAPPRVRSTTAARSARARTAPSRLAWVWPCRFSAAVAARRMALARASAAVGGHDRPRRGGRAQRPAREAPAHSSLGGGGPAGQRRELPACAAGDPRGGSAGGGPDRACRPDLGAEIAAGAGDGPAALHGREPLQPDRVCGPHRRRDERVPRRRGAAKGGGARVRGRVAAEGRAGGQALRRREGLLLPVEPERVDPGGAVEVELRAPDEEGDLGLDLCEQHAPCLERQAPRGIRPDARVDVDERREAGPREQVELRRGQRDLAEEVRTARDLQAERHRGRAAHGTARDDRDQAELGRGELHRPFDVDVRSFRAAGRASPFLPHRDRVRGFVYDVDTVCCARSTDPTGVRRRTCNAWS